MDSLQAAAHITVLQTGHSTAVGTPAPAGESLTIAAADATDALGGTSMASGSSKGSSHRSIAAAASGVVTRFMKASSDFMSGASQHASGASEAGQALPDQPEEALRSPICELSEYTDGSGVNTDCKLSDEVVTEMEPRQPDCSERAENACSMQPDFVMSDDIIAGRAEAPEADTAVAFVPKPITSEVPQSQHRLVSACWMAACALLFSDRNCTVQQLQKIQLVAHMHGSCSADLNKYRSHMHTAGNLA